MKEEGRGRMMEDSSSSNSNNSNNKVVFPTVESGYDVLEEIGLGASAVVYRALCKPLNRIVAIKCLDLERINCALEDIRREAQLMSLIDHQNLIRAYCSFVVDHYLWVVMPYMDGGSCLHIMKVAHPDGFEEQIIATILKETLKALSYLHQQGHIHRDVKAGNILIDANGGVKLGDFGVSACMFDGGNRKYSRNTFVGTPCWMAPEVMEQKQGYDFRADIWSFGITALELAHGHAPFQKYPPMKVFLMTIQNAPPGLDYERDKRFSKAFREMVSLCLVKDPNKRPTAEKLLKHSFFKQAKSSQFLAHNLLQGVSALWEREKILRENDAARLAQKETPYLEQEETSQNVYKGCMGSWNFDVESLTISNESDDSEPRCDKEDDPRASLIRDNVDSNASSRCSSSLSLTQLENLSSSSHRGASRSTSEKDDTCDSSRFAKNKIIKNADSDTKGTQQGASSIVPPLSIMCNQGVERLPLGKKEPMQVGRFDVFDGDLELESPGWQEIVRQRKIIQTEREKKQMGTDQLNESQDSQCQKVVQNVDSDRKFSRYLSSANPESIVANSGWPPANGNGDPLILDPAFSTNHVTSNKEEFLGLNSKSLEMQENNLSSFVHNLDNKETSLISKSASTGDCFLLSQKNLPIVALVPQLQALIHQTAQQHECLCNMLRSIVPGGSYSSGAGIHIKSHMHNASTDDKVVYLMQRERELMCEMSSLKSKEEGLIGELESLKLKNHQLENQLNSIINQRDADREGV